MGGQGKVLLGTIIVFNGTIGVSNKCTVGEGRGGGGEGGNDCS